MFAVNGNFIWRTPDGPLKADYILKELPRMLLSSVLAHPCDFHGHGESPAGKVAHTLIWYPLFDCDGRVGAIVCDRPFTQRTNLIFAG